MYQTLICVYKDTPFPLKKNNNKGVGKIQITDYKKLYYNKIDARNLNWS